MVRSRLFWKLFLGFTLVNVLAAVALVFATWAWQKDRAAQLVEQELNTAALLLTEDAVAWAKDPSEANAKRLRDLADRINIDLRVSRSGNQTLEAPKHGRDRDAAQSVHTHRILSDDSGGVGELWLERPAQTLTQTLGKLWGVYIFYAPLVALLMVAAGYGVIAHLVGPVRALNRAARAMANGDYQQRAFITNRDELGVLARSFNQMSEELGQRLTELQESDRRQATVLGGMIEGVIAIDDRQRVLFANSAAGKLFDFLPPEVEGRPLLEAARNHSLHQAATTSIDSRTPQRLEIDWDERVLSVQVTPLVGEPATGAIIVLHDTTELRRLENLRRDFVANVSHELKTPLSTIKANAETLLRGAIDDKEHRGKFLRGIDEQSDRLSELIHDMLNLARIESAQQPFEIQSVEVSRAVEECIENHLHRAESKRIELTMSPPEGEAVHLVKADREGLRVILGNLVDNAIKYTPEGGAVWIAWGAEGEHAGRRVRIEVSDTGVGIPEEKLTRVFERFYRVDDARSRHLGGTGLGLSIVKHLAQAFGGSVEVENQPEQGACFAVLLPSG
ncbi:Alkaline phosphatase synthesis sensor protein PhoR [Planctomycetes bacterium MalM25]|nr:Alkaline phosphatase synthesis sensor protein PhoR [Planctomycetes bacterium MalM25]